MNLTKDGQLSLPQLANVSGNRLVFANSNGTLISPSVNAGSTSFASPTTIPDNTCGGLSSGIVISGAPTSVLSSSIYVTINITHTADADLVIYLTAPNGDILNLAYHVSGGGTNFTGTVFNDGYPTFLASGSAPYSGGFKPTGDLTSICSGTGFPITPTVSTFSAIGGGTIDPNGSWGLVVKDLSGANVGILQNWSINIYNNDNVISSNTPLQFDNGIVNKKIVLWDATSNQNQFYGFGINAGTLRYQVSQVGDSHKFYAGASATTSNLLFTIFGTGNATLAGTLTQNSDFRLKKDITKISNSLQNLQAINGYNYHWKNPDADQSLQLGLIAQELQKVYPELVKTDEKGTLSVNYSGLIPVLVEAIKEQQTQIDALKKSGNQPLLNRIEKLEAMLNKATEIQNKTTQTGEK